MNTATNPMHRNASFELRFQSLFNEGLGLAFPCDAQGRVDMDRLTERARINYLGARTLIGREFAMPMLLAATPH